MSTTGPSTPGTPYVHPKVAAARTVTPSKSRHIGAVPDVDDFMEQYKKLEAEYASLQKAAIKPQRTFDKTARKGSWFRGALLGLAITGGFAAFSIFGTALLAVLVLGPAVGNHFLNKTRHGLAKRKLNPINKRKAAIEEEKAEITEKLTDKVADKIATQNDFTKMTPAEREKIAEDMHNRDSKDPMTVLAGASMAKPVPTDATEKAKYIVDGLKLKMAEMIEDAGLEAERLRPGDAAFRQSIQQKTKTFHDQKITSGLAARKSAPSTP